MDPDLGLHCSLEKLLKHFSRRQKQTTFAVCDWRFKGLALCLLGWSANNLCKQFGQRSGVTKRWAFS